MNKKGNKKSQKRFRSDEEMEQVLDGDMSDFISQNDFTLTSFEFAPKNKTVGGPGTHFEKISLRRVQPMCRLVKKSSYVEDFLFLLNARARSSS
jgi:hypothetical protein